MSIADRIKEEMNTQGLSQEELARRCGVSQGAISQLLSGKIARPKFLLELSQILNKTPQYLLSGAESPINYGLQEARYSGEYYKSKSPIGGKIPVLGFASGSSETNAINWDMDVPIDWVDPLPSMSGVAKSAALMILSDSMAPRYRENEIIFVNRSRTPDMGKDCVIDTRDGHTHIKRFLRQDKEHIYLEQFNPPKELKFHKRDVIGIYAVIGRL